MYNCDFAHEEKVIEKNSEIKTTNDDSIDITMDSLSLKFDKNGFIKNSKSYKDTMQNGISISYHNDSSIVYPKFIYNYVNDKRGGLLLEFNDNGGLKTIRESSLFDNGQYITFNENGSIKFICKNEKGQFSGWGYHFDENGKIIKKSFYEEGDVIKEEHISGGQGSIQN